MFKTLLKNTDLVLLILTISLVIIGIVGIYSAGYSDAALKEDYFKQFVWLRNIIICACNCLAFRLQYIWAV